jgi:hypothetical protein
MTTLRLLIFKQKTVYPHYHEDSGLLQKKTPQFLEAI